MSSVPWLCFALEQTGLLGFFKACSSTSDRVSASSCCNFLPSLLHPGNFINGSVDNALTSRMTAGPRPRCPINICTLYFCKAVSVAKNYKKLKICRLFHMQDFSAFYLCLRCCKEIKREYFLCSSKCCRFFMVCLLASPKW